MVMPLVVGALIAVLKGLEKKLEEVEIRARMKIIQTPPLLIRSARLLRKEPDNCKDLLSLQSKRPTAEDSLKKTRRE